MIHNLAITTKQIHKNQKNYYTIRNRKKPKREKRKNKKQKILICCIQIINIKKFSKN